MHPQTPEGTAMAKHRISRRVLLNSTCGAWVTATHLLDLSDLAQLREANHTLWGDKLDQWKLGPHSQLRRQRRLAGARCACALCEHGAGVSTCHTHAHTWHAVRGCDTATTHCKTL